MCRWTITDLRGADQIGSSTNTKLFLRFGHRLPIYLQKGMITMANYYFDASIINRKRGSVTGRCSYISGKRLYDSYKGEHCYNERHDVVYTNIYLPHGVPDEYNDMQTICTKLEEAEHRRDARTARCFIGSLPNELSIGDWIRIVSEFVKPNFTEHNLCSIAAIHRGEDIFDPSRNNPHVHIVVSTRTIDADGFSKKKFREYDKPIYIMHWREHWADVQNRAYERNGLDIRVSHETLEKQGIDREPLKHLSIIDWLKEQRGECTAAGDENRLIRKRNEERSRQTELQREYDLEPEIEICR